MKIDSYSAECGIHSQVVAVSSPHVRSGPLSFPQHGLACLTSR